MCEIYNNYIIEVSAQLSRLIQGEGIDDPILVHEGDLFAFKHIEYDELLSGIRKVSSTKSTGMQGVYARLLHDADDIICPYIYDKH